MARGIMISAYPLTVYRAIGDPVQVSQIYFIVGFVSLFGGLMTPFATRFIPRRWMYTLGVSLYLCTGPLIAIGGPVATTVALLCSTLATVVVFVCFNAYILDYVSKVELGRCETLRLLYSGAAWTVGPLTGVWLMQLWAPAPFFVSGAAGLVLLVMFWRMRLGNGKLITRARRPAPNPLAFLGRFFQQPRLVAGWLFAVLRSCGWWVYVVYLPIFALENGLGEHVGGVALSATNALLFITPLMLRWMKRHSLRHAVRTGFALAAFGFIAATLVNLLGGSPWITIGLLAASSFFLILLDVSGGLPFLLAVKPAERTEMSAIYSSFRDVSGIVTPGTAWLVLAVAPLSVIFAVCGTGLLTAWALAGRLHPRLGAERIAPPPPLIGRANPDLT